MNVHHIHRLFYEQDEIMYENNYLSIEKSKGNVSKRRKSLKRRNLKKR